MMACIKKRVYFREVGEGGVMYVAQKSSDGLPNYLIWPVCPVCTDANVSKKPSFLQMSKDGGYKTTTCHSCKQTYPPYEDLAFERSEPYTVEVSPLVMDKWSK
jgi:hypothetical protein